MNRNKKPEWPQRNVARQSHNQRNLTTSSFAKATADRDFTDFTDTEFSISANQLKRISTEANEGNEEEYFLCSLLFKKKSV